MAAYTEKQRDALKAAIASGALTVEGADIGRVTYRSLDEMQRALAMIEAGLSTENPAGIQRRRIRRVVVVGRSGW